MCYGIECCVYMVGKFKFMMDFFKFEKEEDVVWLFGMFE